MRWLLVSRQHHPSHGGIGTYVQRFTRAAEAAGWHVELVTQPGECQPQCDRVHEVRTRDMEPEFAARLPELRRLHRVRPYRYALWSMAVAERLLTVDGEFDAIEFVDCQAEGFAALGCPAVRQRFARAAFIVHAHTPMFVEEAINGADESQFGRRLYQDWERRALAMADGVIVTSSVLAQRIAHHCAATPRVIPYPIEEDRSAVSLPRERVIVLVGSVQRRKGVDIWARSLNQVLAACPTARATLIGPDTPSGPGGTSMAEHIARTIDSAVRDRFQWTGSLSHEQVREAIARSALVVVPSRLESFSFAAAEALLAGTAVIVSDQAGIAEHVASLPRIPCEDVDAWATSQVDALRRMAQWRETADRCRGEMLSACSPSRVLRMRQDMVRSLMSEASRRQRPAITGDTCMELADFVAGVEAMERQSASAACLASSVSS